MTRITVLLLGLLALLATLAGPVHAAHPDPASGGYLTQTSPAPDTPTPNTLAALGKSQHHADIAPDCCIAPIGGVGSAIPGIYRGARPVNQTFPELVGVNPHFVPGGTQGVNTNCVSCVNAAVARLTGRDLTAVASPSQGYAGRNDLLPSAPFGFSPATTPSGVTARLRAEGDGSVAVVIIPQSNGIEHAIVGVNRGGRVHFIDPQRGEVVRLQTDLTVIPGYN